MQIIRTGVITIYDPPKHLYDAITEALSLRNPSYEQACRANPRARFTITPTIPYWKWDKKQRTLTIGRGAYPRLMRYLERSRDEYVLDDRTVRPPMADTPRMTPKLREYQQGVPDLVAAQLRIQGDGVLRCDTGFGKTVVSLQVANLLNVRTLVIVPKTDLKTQFESTRDDLFAFGESNVEVVTVQKIMRDMNGWRTRANDFGLVIFDECHLAVPAKSRAAVEIFNAQYRLGLTGTARRTDGQGEAIFFTFGPVVVDKKMPRIDPKIRLIEYLNPLIGEDYAAIIDEQVNDPARNEFIADVAASQARQGRKVLILTKRVEHYKIIDQHLKDYGVAVEMLESSTNRGERDATMRRLRDNPNTYQILLGTFSLLSTGTDIPSLDTLIIAGDLKSDVLAEQSAGRILRLFSGKQDPLIIDFQDRGNKILRRQARLRQDTYEGLGWQIE